MNCGIARPGRGDDSCEPKYLGEGHIRKQRAARAM